jgi:hypothetical protein
MDSQNIKVYLAISGALIVLFVLVLIIPFSSKKTTNNNLQPTTSPLFPTSVSTGSSTYPLQPTPYNLTPIPADFTGAIEEKIPQPIIDFAAQKKDLRLKVPLSLSTFTIDFDYNTDKFVVTLKDPKDQAQKEFESWRTANYPGLGSEQFTIR